jgi:cysteine desulfurase/selenocysteine lyase
MVAAITTRATSATQSGLDVERVRAEFPTLQQRVHGRPLVYLDNAATTLKPQVVIDALADYYTTKVSNIHRGVHYLSEQGTLAYDRARTRVKAFINAASDHEIIFTRGTTESINIVAQSFGQKFIKPGDEILITTMEHHSNIVPWQMLCERMGCVLKVAPINDRGELILQEFERLFTPRTRLVSVTHVSNALGTVNPVRHIVHIAHAHGVPVLLDGAQAVAHLKVDVRDLDCDFYAFSGHKLFGPTGIGVLYGKERWLKEMPPVQGGGDMILSVTFAKTTYNELPYKFEAGTPHIAGVMGLAAAIDYVEALGFAAIHAHEQDLLAYATRVVGALAGVTLIGTAGEKSGVLSFTMQDIHPHDIGTLVDAEGVAIRTGHHCAQPVMERFGVPATARASFSLYNTREDVDVLVAALAKVRQTFA